MVDRATACAAAGSRPAHAGAAPSRRGGGRRHRRARMKHGARRTLVIGTESRSGAIRRARARGSPRARWSRDAGQPCRRQLPLHPGGHRTAPCWHACLACRHARRRRGCSRRRSAPKGRRRRSSMREFTPAIRVDSRPATTSPVPTMIPMIAFVVGAHARSVAHPPGSTEPCGMPGECAFSRAVGPLVGHLSRDSTAIEAREKPVTTDKAPPPPNQATMAETCRPTAVQVTWVASCS